MMQSFSEKFSAASGARAKCSAPKTRAGFTLIELLVVIAIIAITLFRPKLQELWDAIASGINSL